MRNEAFLNLAAPEGIEPPTPSLGQSVRFILSGSSIHVDKPCFHKCGSTRRIGFPRNLWERFAGQTTTRKEL